MNDTGHAGQHSADTNEFSQVARAWIAEHREHAPPDYGAILPPHLVERGLAWQQLLYAHRWAGIDWPFEFGGQGLTHNTAPHGYANARSLAFHRFSTWSVSS
jgi:alkylation response protein AidB-like acyl-CoA dehydrogenase